MSKCGSLYVRLEAEVYDGVAAAEGFKPGLSSCSPLVVAIEGGWPVVTGETRTSQIIVVRWKVGHKSLLS